MRIAITTGSPRGIGPEIIVKGLLRLKKTIPYSSVCVFGVRSAYKKYEHLLPMLWISESEFLSKKVLPILKNRILFVSVDQKKQQTKSLYDDYSCGRAVELSVLGIQSGRFSSVVTGPLDKNELQRGGYNFDGHTELLKKLTKAPSVTMMLTSPSMRVSLVTTHVPLAKVSSTISIKKISQTIETTYLELQKKFNIRRPRIAVLGLNPHAGDGGLFGREEKTKIKPAILKSKKTLAATKITGPHSSDGFFAQWNANHRKNTDAVICMYHDQGLIPLKLLDFERSVNVSLGLPIIRTSVDHGPAFDIAGKNIANPSSFCEALLLAKRLTRIKASKKGRRK